MEDGDVREEAEDEEEEGEDKQEVLVAEVV